MNDKPFFGFSRRDFMKSTAASAASFGILPTFFIPSKPDPFEGGIRPHPNFDPLRVAGIHDPGMTVEEAPMSTWKTQENLVQADVIGENIDRLACTLAGEKRGKDAWKKIFLKPPGKDWSDVTVAVKTNNIADQHTRSPVMAKLCRVLTQELGVKASRIIIYDACHGKDMLRKTPFKGLPDGCRVASLWGGFTREVLVDKPWKNGESKTTAVNALAEGEVDILVNIALCKGHFPQFGLFTMTMKNHLGTFNPRPHAHADGATDYLIAINKSPLILGDLDDKKKKVAFPRQQLCLIDALWASEKGPMGISDAQPNRLYMGTFNPAMDYLVAHALRKKTMGWEINEEVTERFLKEFGYSPADLPEGGIVDASKA
jgi:hypothetical protein